MNLSIMWYCVPGIVAGLPNNLNRWYESIMGRWMSEDPTGFYSGDDNLTRYVGNAPLARTDPLGLKFVGPMCTPCFGAYHKCTFRNGMMYAACIGSIPITGVIELVGCAAFCSWLGVTGFGYLACVSACTTSIAGLEFLLIMPHCDDALFMGEMKCGSQYNRCALEERGCGCGPGNENWRPD